MGNIVWLIPIFYRSSIFQIILLASSRGGGYEFNVSPETEVALSDSHVENVPYATASTSVSPLTSHFFVDHGGRRLQPIPLPVDQLRPT